RSVRSGAGQYPSLRRLAHDCRGCADPARIRAGGPRLQLAPSALTSSPTVSESPWPGNGCCRTMPIARGGRSSPSTDPMASLTARPTRPISTNLVSGGSFSPNSAVCDEYGSDHTQLLTVLNAAGEAPVPTRYLVIRTSQEHPTSSTTAFRTAPSPAFP